MKRLIFVLFFSMIFSIGCRTVTLEKRLDPAGSNFLNLVQYIISDEEKKIFLELPPWEREKFIEDFWKRRDPIPQTGQNEFKELYLRRVDEANRLFSKGRKGMLTDRGRIYILLGPPDEILKSEGGQTIDPFAHPSEVVEPIREGTKPSETWIYRNIFSSFEQRIFVRLDFVDVDATGDYKLVTNLREAVPGTISSLLSPNLTILHELNKEEFMRKRLTETKPLFDFNWEIRKIKDEESNLLIHLGVPVKSAYFIEEEGFLKTTFRLNIRIMDPDGRILWEYRKDYPFSVSRSDVENRRIEIWSLEVPVAYILPKGSYNVYIHLMNLAGEEEVKKFLPFKI